MPGGKRRWCFTINDIPQDLSTTPTIDFDPTMVNFAVYQLERGEGTNHLHVQGYCELSGSHSRGKVAVMFAPFKPHLQPAFGTRTECVAYCSKSDTRVATGITFGQPVGQGQRSDLLDAIKRIKSSEPLRESMDSEEFCVTFAKFTKGLTTIRGVVDKSPVRPNIVSYVLYGPSGTRKTRLAMGGGDDVSPDQLELALSRIYKKEIGHKWFDGYDGQIRLVLDEFTGWLPFTYLLQILDIYPLYPECKGGTVAAKWQEVYITSNKHPYLWYQKERNDIHWPALVRRISFWVYCDHTEWFWYTDYE